MTSIDFSEQVKEEREVEGYKEKSPLTTNNFSITEGGDDKKEQIFWRIYDELEQQQPHQQQAVEQQLSNCDLKTEIDGNNSTVNGQELKNRLISSNEFYVGEAFQMIEDMVKAGKLEKVAFDTYKRKKSSDDDNNNRQ